MAPNVPLLLEAHFAVPMAGAVLNAINTRLDPRTIAYVLAHSEAKLLIADTEYHEVVRKALALLERPNSRGGQRRSRGARRRAPGRD